MPRGTEIERKFLLASNPPGLDAASWADLRQGYVLVAAGGEVRLRDAAGRLTLTVKSGQGLARGEREIDLTSKQFDELWPATLGRRVEKRRYRLPSGERVFEIDVYAGDLRGLVVVEVEFPTVEDAERFVPCAWMGREVTGVPGYTNAELAVSGVPQDAPLP